MRKPTKRQLLAKSKFWEIAKDNPLVDPAAITPAALARIAGVTLPAATEWFKDPDFAPWLLDEKTLTHKARMGASLALDKLIQIVEANDVGPREAVTSSNQVAAAKILIDAARVAEEAAALAGQGKDNLPDTEEELRKYILKTAGKAGIKHS